MTVADELQARIETIEESYEFFLAYAARGASGDQASKSSGQVREFLQRTERALPELPDLFAQVVDERGVANPTRYHSFIDVLRGDVGNSLAAVQLVLAQPAISSQMIDNLNAMIHLRALLTDVFLIDEILSPRQPGGSNPSPA